MFVLNNVEHQTIVSCFVVVCVFVCFADECAVRVCMCVCVRVGIGVCVGAPTPIGQCVLTALRCQPVFTTRSVRCMSILINDDCSDLFNGETGDMSPMSGNTHHKRYRQNTMFITTPVKVY